MAPTVGHSSGFIVRAAEPADAPTAASVVREAYGDLLESCPAAAEAADAERLAMLIQTGAAVLVAEGQSGIVGAASWREDDGAAWIEFAASVQPRAGRALVRTIERRAQDRGLRFARVAVVEGSRAQAAFAFWGYTPVARREGVARPLLVLERRLPLLTVREVRRADAEALASLTGRDAWFFAELARPGWYAAADGERVVGVVWAERREADWRVGGPLLLEEYRGRGLERWMLERAAQYAAMHGAQRIVAAASPLLIPLARELEERGWQREGDRFVRDLIAFPPLLETLV
ncbi:hypothetical protein HRbin29_01612 [bacterium HR29]|nr:hypothetical protein HRbin29_01612 [bacterium HR29]